MRFQRRSNKARPVNGPARNAAKRSTTKRVLQGLLSLLLIVVIVVGAVVLTAPHFGWRFSAVYSGSMEPSINVGGVVVIRPVDAENIREGDVITFRSLNDANVMITHRVVDVIDNDVSTSFRTKGDANEDADGALVSTGNVVGRVWLDIPYAGYVMDFIHKPLGFGLVIGIPALILILMEVRSISLTVRGLRRKRCRKQSLLRQKQYVTKTQVD